MAPLTGAFVFTARIVEGGGYLPHCDSSPTTSAVDSVCLNATGCRHPVRSMSREQLRQLFHTSHDDKHNRRRAFRSAVLRSTQALNAAKKMKARQKTEHRVCIRIQPWCP